MKKFTFKKTINTGRYRSFELDYTNIKLGGKIVGTIGETRDSHGYKIRFMIKKEETKEKPSPFKSIFFKKLFSTEEEAREYIKTFNDQIQEKFDLYQLED